MSEAAERFTPQLVMRCSLFGELPAPTAPPEYELRSFVEGDGAAWVTIVNDAFDRQDPADSFFARMAADPAFLPERVWFVTHAGEPVATASAWERHRWTVGAGYLHMVAVRRAHQGKGLGAVVSVAALRRMVVEGKRVCYLETDDYRLAAIRTYLRLGFEPYLVHENQRERWRAVLGALGSGLVEAHAERLAGPPEPRLDD